jgi:hypothetical protein
MKIAKDFLFVTIICSLLPLAARAGQESDNEKDILKATLSYLVESDRLSDAKEATEGISKNSPMKLKFFVLMGWFPT